MIRLNGSFFDCKDVFFTYYNDVCFLYYNIPMLFSFFLVLK